MSTRRVEDIEPLDPPEAGAEFFATAKLTTPWPADRPERRSVAALTAHPKNARTHSAKQIAQLAKAIQRFGWTMPLLIDEADTIIAGHGRVMAAQQLGMTEVPVLVARGWSEQQKRAYLIADNQLALNAGWDESLLRLEVADLQGMGVDLDALGFGRQQARALLGVADGEEDPDDLAPPTPIVAVTKRGDLWALGDHRLLCGDATSEQDVARLMSGERASLFSTDPPYLVDYDGTNHPQNSNRSARAKRTANKDWSDQYIEPGQHWDASEKGPQFYEAFMRVAIQHAIRGDVAWYCWHASRRQAMLEACWAKFDVLFHQQIVWAKSRPVLTRSVLLWAHEPCMFGWVAGNKPRINRDGFERWPTTVWQIPSSEIATREHPTSKPVRVFTLPMDLHTLPGEICYEPFSGSGSQFIAGERTGRRVFGLELSEVFCDVTLRRWQDHTGKAATLDGKPFAEVAAERGVQAAEE